jgi:hypothetical protein
MLLLMMMMMAMMAMVMVMVLVMVTMIVMLLLVLICIDYDDVWFMLFFTVFQEAQPRWHRELRDALGKEFALSTLSLPKV